MLAQLTAFQQLEVSGFNTTAAATPTYVTRARAAAGSCSARAAGPPAIGNHSSSGGVDTAQFTQVLDDLQSIVGLLKAIGGLPQLGSVSVELPVVLLGKEVKELKVLAQQLLPSHMVPCFHATVKSRHIRLKMLCIFATG
jgi:hypothetical protein